MSLKLFTIFTGQGDISKVAVFSQNSNALVAFSSQSLFEDKYFWPAKYGFLEYLFQIFHRICNFFITL